MKALLAGLASAVVLWPAAALADWDWSAFPGEEGRSVLGCSDTGTDDSWLCLAVRCDAPGNLNLYIELTNLDVNDSLDVVVGDQRFRVSGTSNTEAPYSSRLDGDTGAILAALKVGSSAVLDRPQYPFNPGYDTIPLRGSSRAIGALEAQCGVGDVGRASVVDEVAETMVKPVLPLEPGIYVRVGTTCQGLSHATTLNFTGDHMNAQRVLGKIVSVREQSGRYQVKVSGHDIADGVDIGEFDWTLTIPARDKFSFAADSGGESYRRCFDKMPG